jgi:hypothetical protein
LITLTNAAHINSDTLVELLTAIDRLYHNAAITLVMNNTRYQRCAKTLASGDRKTTAWLPVNCSRVFRSFST